MTETVYISLGSNLDNPLQQVIKAIEEIGQIAKTHVTNLSPWYRSSPMGPQDQPNYINGVAELRTELTPHQLLNALQAIEQSHRRIRAERWGPRTLDLDILLFGSNVIQHPTLKVPHPGMTERNFVLLPLHDIAPDLVLPNGTTLVTLLEICSSEGIVRLSPNEGNEYIG